MMMKLPPDEDVDLLIDDVQRENTEAIFLFDGTRGAVVVEGTLRHLGEHFGHGIGSVFALHLRVGHDIQAIGGELVAEEIVGEVDLGPILQTFYVQLLLPQIPKTQKWSQAVSLFLRFWDLHT